MNAEKYNRIWELIQKASNEEKKRIIDNLSDEDLINLRHAANPYRKPLYEPKSKILAFSSINMNEEYTKNFMMTSVVGFLYKMATEFSFSSLREENDGFLSPPLFADAKSNGFLSPLRGERDERDERDEKIEINESDEKKEGDCPQGSSLTPGILPEAKCGGRERERESEEEGILAEEISDRLKAAYFEKFETVYKSAYERSGAAVDKARWMRAQIVVFKKQNGTEAEEITRRENVVKSFCKEQRVNYEEAFPNEVQLNEDEINIVKQAAKKHLGIKMSREEHDTKIQNYILDFLDYYLKFDPNNHIRCGYYPHYDPVIKKAFESNPEQFKIINAPNGNEMMVTDKFEKYLIPPLDTFYSLNNFINANYEPLRQATNDIYFPAIFENAIIARESFANMDDADKWKKKFGSELDVAVNDIEYGKWVFIDSWAQNREKTTYDDEKGKLINEIIERKKQEEKMGKEILGKKKRKNKRATGASDVPFTSEAASLGAERLEKMATTQERKEEDLEVNVFSTKLLRQRRGVKTASSNFSINTPSLSSLCEDKGSLREESSIKDDFN